MEKEDNANTVWSLQGKDVNPFHQWYDMVYKRYYEKQDIDTLRDKLIEDFENHYWDSLSEHKSLIIVHVKEILFRRFGVEK